MSARWPVWMAIGGALAFVALLVACGQQQEQAMTPGVEERTITWTLSPAPVRVRVHFLKGELDELRVTARVEPGSDTLVHPPVLRARLKLRNTSRDQAIRIASGRIEYVDRKGAPIPVEEAEEAGFFDFLDVDRLDPGMETVQSIEVPFPADALNRGTLGDIRLELAYLATPYRPEAAYAPHGSAVPLRPWEELWY